MYHTIRWTSDKIRQRITLLESLVYRRRHPLPPFRYASLDGPLDQPPISPDLNDREWLQISWGSSWGHPNSDFVLRSRFQVPTEWPSSGPLALHLPIGETGDFSHPEALVYIDGHAYAACDRHHQEIQLPAHWCDGTPHHLALHGWTGGTDMLYFDPASTEQDKRPPLLIMRPCGIVQIHQPTRDLIALARVALGVADNLDEVEPTRANLYTALDEAFKVLDTLEPFGERFYESVPAAYEALQAGIARSGAPKEVDITAAGHAHIDVAWLWTLGQTRRKAGRTFHTVLRLMEQFPEFHFSQSQPQLYDYVRQDYPELFEAIRLRISEGRWEPVGGMWVEADCNVSGGESLARQLLLGLDFFRRHFGQQGDTPVLWLPDVFGYAWNLPQLIKEAGLEFFFTIKIGWSQYNRLPYDSFWWQGLDGTRVLTHFSPTRSGSDSFVSTYNASASPEQILNTWANFQQKDWGPPGLTPPLLMAYGFGDGGGGPTPDMVENIRLMADFPGVPRVQCGTAAQFFHKLKATVGDRLPTWNGELYLEYHRGTYTTQARNKRANRKSEFLLHDAEFLAALATTLDPSYAYPHPALRRAWELVCLNQFHDIIPGSSIGQVYVESLQQYAEIQDLAQRVIREGLAVIGEKTGFDLFVINPTSFARSDLVFWAGGELGAPALLRADGSAIPMQTIEEGMLLDVGTLPPYSVTPLHAVRPSILDTQHAESSVIATPERLENDFLRVEFSPAGDIIHILDKVRGREVLPPGALANQFQAFEDRPRTPDAWEIDVYYDDRTWFAEPAESIQVVETGPLRAALLIRRRILNSNFTQHISLAHNSRRLDFDTTIDWQERHVLLKVAFPVDVLSPQATYEIQWGNVQRPTHRNTSWDWARFETCGHKWVDLSEGDYGVSLLNDCKYGHDIQNNVMRLTLLRGPTVPDPVADLGKHRFTYSLLPHASSWDEFTISQAYLLNDPSILWEAERGERSEEALSHPPSSSLPGPMPLVAVDRPNVVIETVKQAEDGQGLIVRLYESQRRRAEFILATAFPLAGAWRTNLLEENQERVETDGNSLCQPIKPYQIVTLRLLPQ
jgi:alpha-mannosidase